MRQYIGARYVPKFFENPNGGVEWMAGIPYESLTIVTYLSGSYTSKKAVPPGIGNPASNPDYWVLTSNFPGQIGDLTVRVTALDARLTDEVASLNQEIDDTETGLTTLINNTSTTLQGNIDTTRTQLQGNIDTTRTQLQGNIDTTRTQLQGNIDTTNANLAKLTQIVTTRKFIWIGDSYGMRHEVNWCQYAQDRLGGTIYAYSSYGFIPSSNRFITLLQNAANDETNPESITDIVVCGGWNDAREIAGGATLQALQNAIISFCTYAKNHFPNAKVHIGFMAWQTKFVTQTGVTPLSINQTRKVYNGTNASNLYHLSACQYPLLLTRYLDDTFFHPNDDGGTELGMAVVGELLGDYDVNAYYNVTKSMITNSSQVDNNFLLRAMISNGVLELTSGYFKFNGTVTGQNIIEFTHANMPFSLLRTGIFLLGYVTGSGVHDGNTVILDGVQMFYYDGDAIRFIYKGGNTYFTSLNMYVKLFLTTDITRLELSE